MGKDAWFDEEPLVIADVGHLFDESLLLQAEGVSKAFPGVEALTDMRLDLRNDKTNINDPKIQAVLYQ